MQGEPTPPPQSISENRQAYGEFIKGPMADVEALKQSRELVSVLGMMERGLGLTEKTVAGEQKVRLACDTYRNGQSRIDDAKKQAQPFDEAAATKNIQEDRQSILDFLRKNHGNLFYILETSMGGIDKPEERQLVEELIVSQVANINGVKNSLLPQTDKLRLDALATIGSFLFNHTDSFGRLKTYMGEGMSGAMDEAKFFDRLAETEENLTVTTAINQLSVKVGYIGDNSCFSKNL